MCVSSPLSLAKVSFLKAARPCGRIIPANPSRNRGRVAEVVPISLPSARLDVNLLDWCFPQHYCNVLLYVGLPLKDVTETPDGSECRCTSTDWGYSVPSWDSVIEGVMLPGHHFLSG